MLFRLPVNALILQRPHINPGVIAVALKVAVGQPLPLLAQFLNVFVAVSVVLLLLAFGARKTIRADFPQRAPHVHVPVARIAFGVGPVNIDDDRIAFPLPFLAHKILTEAAVLFERHFARQGNIEVEPKLRVGAFLRTLDLVHKLLKVVHPFRRTLRRINAGELRRAEMPVIPHFPGLLIDQTATPVIGCGRDDAAALATADARMHAEVCCRHTPYLAAATCRMAG